MYSRQFTFICSNPACIKYRLLISTLDDYKVKYTCYSCGLKKPTVKYCCEECAKVDILDHQRRCEIYKADSYVKKHQPRKIKRIYLD
jgi:hypothetical protein